MTRVLCMQPEPLPRRGHNALPPRHRICDHEIERRQITLFLKLASELFPLQRGPHMVSVSPPCTECSLHEFCLHPEETPPQAHGLRLPCQMHVHRFNVSPGPCRPTPQDGTVLPAPHKSPCYLPHKPCAQGCVHINRTVNLHPIDPRPPRTPHKIMAQPQHYSVHACPSIATLPMRS